MSITSLYGPPMPEEAEQISLDAYPDVRACSKCLEEKPLTEFHKDRTHSSGYRSQCRSCRSEARVGRGAKRRELDEKGQINRDALLRLVQAHRSEFESYVNAETVRRRGPEGGVPLSRAAWIRLA